MGLVEILLSVCVPTLIGVGMTFASMSDAGPREFLFARFCFVLAGCLAIGLTLRWLSETDWPALQEVLIGFLITVPAAVATAGAVLWVGSREGERNAAKGGVVYTQEPADVEVRPSDDTPITDWEQWDQNDRYYLSQWAALASGRVPGHPMLDPGRFSYFPTFKLLKSAAKKGRLRVVQSHGNYRVVEALRSDVQAFFLSIGKRPRGIFPPAQPAEQAEKSDHGGGDLLTATGVVGPPTYYTPRELEYLLQATREMLNYVDSDVASVARELEELGRKWPEIVQNGGINALRAELKALRGKVVAVSQQAHAMPRRDSAFRNELEPLFDGKEPHWLRDAVTLLDARLAVMQSIAKEHAADAIRSDMHQLAGFQNELVKWIQATRVRLEIMRGKLRTKVGSG